MPGKQNSPIRLKVISTGPKTRYMYSEMSAIMYSKPLLISSKTTRDMVRTKQVNAAFMA